MQRFMLPPTLIRPALDVQAALADKRLPRRFKRIDKRALEARRTLDLVAAALGIEAPPAGGLARLADGLEAQGQDWFRAQPVMLVPDRDSLRMIEFGAQDALRDDEAQALAETAREHFGSRLRLERGASGRWYAALTDVDEVACVAPGSEAGKKLLVTSFADGPDARALRAFLNELQMLWFEHPVNLARRKAGRAEVSSLWLWGNGRLPAPPAVEKPMELIGSAPEIAGLARWLDCDWHTPGWASSDVVTDGTVVVIDAEEATLGPTWLDAFLATRGAWRLYTREGEWPVAARRGLLRWFG